MLNPAPGAPVPLILPAAARGAVKAARFADPPAAPDAGYVGLGLAAGDARRRISG